MAVNKHEVEQRFRRSITTYNANAMVQKAMAVRLNRMVMSSLDYIPKNILEVGCGTGLFTEELRRCFKEDEIYVNDIVEEVCSRTARLYQVIASHCLPGDIEEIPLPGRSRPDCFCRYFSMVERTESDFQKIIRTFAGGRFDDFQYFWKVQLAGNSIDNGRRIKIPDTGGVDGTFGTLF